MSVFLVKSFESGRKSFLCANKTMRTLIHRSNKSLKFLFISNSNNFFHSPIVCVTRGQKKKPYIYLKIYKQCYRELRQLLVCSF